MGREIEREIQRHRETERENIQLGEYQESKKRKKGLPILISDIGNEERLGVRNIVKN